MISSHGYLTSIGITELREINQIANFAVVEWPDNIKISDQAPKDYAPAFDAKMSSTEREDMQRWHALPPVWWELPYEQFLKERRVKMASLVREAYQKLCGSTPAPQPTVFSIAELLAAGESSVVEFKSTLRTNLHTSQIDDQTNANVLDDELARDIAAAMASELPPAIPDLQELYDEANVVLNAQIMNRYDEVESFHKAVVSNRRDHLKAEALDTASRIEERKRRIASMSNRRNELLEIISSGGALQQYRKLDSQLSSTRSQYEATLRQLELAEKLDAMRSDLKVQRAEAERRIVQDLIERRTVVEEAALVFDEISQRLYDQPAVFDIVADKDGLNFKVEAPEIASDGIKQVQIFTFDLTLATICARRGAWPGFLIHDSHIFDGVDGRQIALALQIAGERVAELKGQYIVTMNSDDLEKAEREGGVSFAEHIVEPELDDSPTGCLFGFRFATADDPLDRPLGGDPALEE